MRKLQLICRVDRNPKMEIIEQRLGTRSWVRAFEQQVPVRLDRNPNIRQPQRSQVVVTFARGEQRLRFVDVDCLRITNSRKAKDYDRDQIANRFARATTTHHE